MDRHYQILALDNTIATTIASERLAAKLLQQGYDVSITGYTHDWEHRLCILQSNLDDPPPGGALPQIRTAQEQQNGWKDYCPTRSSNVSRFNSNWSRQPFDTQCIRPQFGRSDLCTITALSYAFFEGHQ
eukprot:GEMP01038748.1.p2 GENE.GEMP01038748.1~~GEMP01038748.1.p2  ORF type:complete len:129 (+),score=8.94 GEMP01038748.1:192-578(+)